MVENIRCNAKVLGSNFIHVVVGLKSILTVQINLYCYFMREMHNRLQANGNLILAKLLKSFYIFTITLPFVSPLGILFGSLIIRWQNFTVENNVANVIQPPLFVLKYRKRHFHLYQRPRPTFSRCKRKRRHILFKKFL